MTSSKAKITPSRLGKIGVPKRWVATVRLPGSKIPVVVPPPQPQPFKGERGRPSTMSNSLWIDHSGSLARVVMTGPCTPTIPAL